MTIKTLTTTPHRLTARPSQTSNASQQMMRERESSSARYEAPMVEQWTPTLISSLMRACRLSNDEVARRAEVHPKTVERWQMQAQRIPHPRHQRILDELLAGAPEAAQIRFCRLAGLRPVREVRAPGAEWEDCRAELGRLSTVLDELAGRLGLPTGAGPQ